MIPTIFHVTHWKAGAQWIHKILRACTPDLVVAPQIDEVQFLKQPLQAGKVYPTVYVTRQQFESVALPDSWRRFVVIRDLRDTAVSAYFSFLFSHPAINAIIVEGREFLSSMDSETALTFTITEWLPNCAAHSAILA